MNLADKLDLTKATLNEEDLQSIANLFHICKNASIRIQKTSEGVYLT